MHLVLALFKETNVGLFDWVFGVGTPVAEFLTQGPAADEHPWTDVGERYTAAHTDTFTSGWYDRAVFTPAHTGRVGGLIVPETVVVHTTDMPPNDFAGLVKAWSTSAGLGAAAHFILGRDPDQGLVQMIPITSNANHAGGPTKNGTAIHGWWVTPDGHFVHPNIVAVGIEVHAAGMLYWKKGSTDVAEYVEDRKVRAEFSRSKGDVYVDSLNRPWHAITAYQLDSLGQLLRDLCPSLKASTLVPKADAAFIKDRTRWDTSYAVPAANTLVGHVSLDPINKTDPGPQLMTFINDFARKEEWK